MADTGVLTEAGPRFIPDRTPDHLDRDAFRVGPVAERIATVLGAVNPPFTISLSGSWGVGKTTLIEEVKRRLPDARIVFIDAWTEDLPRLRRTLAIELGGVIGGHHDEEGLEEARRAAAKRLDEATRRTVTEDLDTELHLGSAWRRMPTHINKYPERSVAVFLFGLAFVVVTMLALKNDWEIAGLLSTILTAAAVLLLVSSGQIMSTRTSKQTTGPAAEALTLGTELRSLVRRPSEGGSSILLIVDNLDRLQGGDAMTVLADIRAFVDDPQSRCVFLIPIDREAFGRSVQQLIGSVQAARDYLEKFFNLDIVLTRPADMELRSWTRGLLETVLPDHDDQDRTTAAVLIAVAAAGSPRAAKRMVNGVSARYWLIEERLRVDYSLGQLAVLEGLIAQFPGATAVVARDARVLVDARAALRNAVDNNARDGAIAALAPDVPTRTRRLDVNSSDIAPEQDAGQVDPDDGGFRTREALALRDFLVAAEAIPLTFDDITTVLSLRDDPSMLGVPNAAAVRDALRSGQSDVLGVAIGGLEDGARTLAMQRAVDLARQDIGAKLFPSAVAIVNALAPHLDDRALRANLRSLASEALVHVDTTLYRTLPDTTVSLVFEANDAEPRLRRIADLAAEALVADPAVEPRLGLVRVVAAGADLLDDQRLAGARTALASLPDADLAPLFEPAPRVVLVTGDVSAALVGRLARWTPEMPVTDLDVPAMRLICAVEDGAVPSAHLDPIATALAPQLSAVSSESVPGIEILTEVLAHADPGPNVDALAQGLATWTADPDLGLRLACRLPLEAAAQAQIAAAGTRFATSQPASVIRENLAETRHVLREAGADLWSPLVRRWIDGEGEAFLSLVLADPGPEAWEAVRAQLAAVVIASFAVRFNDGCAGLVGAGAVGAALDTVRDLFATRVAEMSPGTLSACGAGLASLASYGCDVTVAGTAAGSRLAAMAPGDVEAWTSAMQDLGTAVPSLAPALAREVTTYSRAIGAVDLTRVPWLLAHGADREQVKASVVSEIGSGRLDTASLAAGVGHIRGDLRRVWVVRRALVLRARANGAGTDSAPLLEQAKLWNPVPPGERVDYDSALTDLLAFGASPELVGDLRG